MKKTLALGMGIFAASLLASTAVFGQVLYSETFDDGNASTRWTVNTTGMGLDLPDALPVPMDTNFDVDANGVVDDLSGFAFDYSSVGIPSAPNSSGSTLGMKLQANLFSDAFGGFSVSPNGQNFTGDYVVTFDIWANTVGPLPGGGSGSTNLSEFGILTDGTTPTYPGTADGVWFGMVGDGNTTSDYRVYSSEKVVSHQIPLAPTDPLYDPKDTYATYLAASRNSSASLYANNFSPTASPVSPPASQTALFPGQTGNLGPGAPGFAWRNVEIKKEGNLVSWSMDGVLLITLDMTNFETTVGGGNILFGHADINDGSSTDPNAQFLLFTLIDNIEVSGLESAPDGDFDLDGDVDGRDFLVWQRGDSPDPLSDTDLAAWQGAYGGGALGAVTAVPEPASLVSILGATLLLGLRRRS